MSRVLLLTALGICCGALLWVVSFRAAVNASPKQPGQSEETASPAESSHSVAGIGDTPTVADSVNRIPPRVPEGDSPSDAGDHGQEQSYKRTLSLEERGELRIALGAPNHADWREIIRGTTFNPGRQEVSEEVTREIDSIVARMKPLLDQLGAYVISTQALELEQLREAGIALVVKPGESPWTIMKEKDLVYTVQTNGAGLVASRSKMPRLQEAQASLLAAGKDLGCQVAELLERRGVFGRNHGAWLDKIIKSWHL